MLNGTMRTNVLISPTIFSPKFSRYNYGNYNVPISNALIGREIKIGVLENITNI